MATFEFINPSSSAYFTYETVRNEIGFYDSASLKAASGSLTAVSNVPEGGLIQSDYIWSVVVPPGSSIVEFIAGITVPAGSVYFRGTGEFNVTITT